MILVFTLIAIILTSFLFTFTARKIKLPRVVAMILAGLVLGFPKIADFVIGTNLKAVTFLGDLGLLSLMFLAGLESTWSCLYDEKRDSALIAAFGVAIPFIMGYFLFRFLGFSQVVSLIVGLSMSITAEATTVQVLLDLKKVRTKVGTAMIGAGIIDDTIGLLSFIAINLFFGMQNFNENFLLVSSLLVFFIGTAIPVGVIREGSIKNIENILLWLIIPFFFISMGLLFDLQQLAVNVLLFVAILLIATVGKIMGAMLAKPFTSFKWRQAYLIGWGMNSRGAIEIALVVVALRNGLIPVALYSSLIMMALTTTLIFPFVINYMIKKHPRIMN